MALSDVAMQPSQSPTLHPRLRPIDRLVLGYVAVASAVAVVRLPKYPGCRWLLVAHCLIALLVALLSRPDLGRVGRLIREVYPLVLLVALYSALDVLNGSGAALVHDVTVQRWEAYLFGGQPSRDWWRAAPSVFWSTVLHGAYLSYYLIFSLPAAYFAVRRQMPALRTFIFALMLTFFSCYLVFIFYPVAGPYYAFPRPTGPFVANPMARLLYWGLETGSSYGAAFPSSHVAATAAALVAGWWGSRRVGLALLLPTVLLIISVVYCQMHYIVDVLAGLVVAAGALWVTSRVRARC